MTDIKADLEFVRDAIYGYYGELDQNKCVGLEEHRANDIEMRGCLAALGRVAAAHAARAYKNLENA